MEKPARLDYLDRAKGFLIILMIAGHIWQHGYQYYFIYAFHMPAFFIISGYLLSLTRSYGRGYLPFAKKRLFSFLLPYLFMDLLGILHDIIRNGVLLSWKGYLFNTISLRANDGDVWFLRTLLVIELLFPLLLAAVKRRSVLVSVAVLTWSIPVFLSSDNVYVVILFKVLSNLLFFTVGFFWGKGFSQRRLWLLLLSLLFVCASALVKWKGVGLPFPAGNLLHLAAAFGGSYLILQLAMAGFGPLSPILAYFGKNSIIVYCTHHVLYAAIGLLIGHADFKTIGLWPGMIILLSVLILEYPLIYIINRWLPFLAGRHYRDRHKYIRIPAN